MSAVLTLIADKRINWQAMRAYEWCSDAMTQDLGAEADASGGFFHSSREKSIALLDEDGRQLSLEIRQAIRQSIPKNRAEKVTDRRDCPADTIPCC